MVAQTFDVREFLTMISLFWKHIAPRLTLCCGLLTLPFHS